MARPSVDHRFARFSLAMFVLWAYNPAHIKRQAAGQHRWDAHVGEIMQRPGPAKTRTKGTAMPIVRDLLATKGTDVATIEPDKGVLDAVAVMNDRRIRRRGYRRRREGRRHLH